MENGRLQIIPNLYSHILIHHRQPSLLAQLHNGAGIPIIPIAQRNRPIHIRGIIVYPPPLAPVRIHNPLILLPQPGPYRLYGGLNQGVGPPKQRHFFLVFLKYLKHIFDLYIHLFIVFQKRRHAGVIENNLFPAPIRLFNHFQPFFRYFHIFFVGA